MNATTVVSIMPWGQPGAHEHALVTVATMVGALALVRAVDDARLSDALREAALKHLPPPATDASCTPCRP